MSYLVLARKYRPRTFADVVGQQPVVQALANALDNERLHHAYLFTGTRGVGKTTLARILAACFNCETGVTSTPCGTCGACTAIAGGRFIDLIEVDAASRTGVDDTRELLTNAQFLPGQGRYKVYLIDEVHMLTGHSFNALLKTLEEPPEHVKFLLATTEAKKIPVTVLSRCLQFNLKNMLPQVIEEQLAKVLAAERIDAEAAALSVIARAAAGSMRDALSIADQAISHGGGGIAAASVNDMLGIAGRDEVGALLDALASGDSAKLLAAGDDLSARSLDLSAVLGELQRAFHDLAIATELGVEPAAPHERFKDVFAAEDLQLYYQIALMGGRDLEFAPDAKVGFDMTLLRLASFEPQAATPSRPADEQREAPAATLPTQSAASADAARPSPAQRQSAPATNAASMAAPAPVAAGANNETVPQAAVTKTPFSVATPSPTPVAASATATSSATASVNARSKAQAAPPTVAAEPPSTQTIDTSKAAAPVDLWHQLVAKMNASGVARMILDHANLRSRDTERWVVRLDERHRSLLNDARQREIAGLVAQVEGRKLRVEFEIGTLDDETPADRRERERGEQRAKAEAVLLQDANVQALLQEFGGRLEFARLHDDAENSRAAGAQQSAGGA